MESSNEPILLVVLSTWKCPLYWVSSGVIVVIKIWQLQQIHFIGTWMDIVMFCSIANWDHSSVCKCNNPHNVLNVTYIVHCEINCSYTDVKLSTFNSLAFSWQFGTCRNLHLTMSWYSLSLSLTFKYRSDLNLT